MTCVYRKKQSNITSKLKTMTKYMSFDILSQYML